MESNRLLWLVVVLGGLLSCEPSKSAGDDLYAVAVQEYTVPQSYAVNGLEFTLHCSSAEERQVEVLQHNPGQRADSLINSMRLETHFRLRIAPDKRYCTGDVLWHGIQDYTAYNDRMHLLNFRFQEAFELKQASGSEPAVFCQMSNSFGLTDYRDFNIVFDMPQPNESFEVVFHDPVFSTGIHHFRFPPAAPARS